MSRELPANGTLQASAKGPRARQGRSQPPMARAWSHSAAGCGAAGLLVGHSISDTHGSVCTSIGLLRPGTAGCALTQRPQLSPSKTVMQPSQNQAISPLKTTKKLQDAVGKPGWGSAGHSPRPQLLTTAMGQLEHLQ